MQKSQESEEIVVACVRAEAWRLMVKITTTDNPSEKRQLARRAFQLAQFASCIDARDAVIAPQSEASPPLPLKNGDGTATNGSAIGDNTTDKPNGTSGRAPTQSGNARQEGD